MVKRIFDIVFAVFALLFLVGIIVLLWILTSIDTRANGMFTQERVGQFGKLFKIYKLRTINDTDGSISGFGAFLRKYKIDEWPQLWNVLIGDMSMVGPRPDIQGYYDVLEGEERNILALKPGITSRASIKYFNEEYLLEQQQNPKQYNDEVIFKDKVRLNLAYYHHHTILEDVKIILATVCFFATTKFKK